VKFNILLTRKIKDNSIRDLVGVFEAIQSYDFDWEFYLISNEERELSSLEKITPVPSSPGALSILHFIYSEKKLIEYLPYKPSVKKKIEELLKRGYQASRIIKVSILEKILEEHPEILVSCFFEVALPLVRAEVREEELLGGVFEEYELVKTEYYYLDPSIVKSVLEESQYLYEYLEKLSQIYEKRRSEDKGIILLLRGSFPVSATLSELEKVVTENLKTIEDNVYDRVLLYNRLIPYSEKLF